MRVLLITTDKEDYLQDSVIHGFKELLGINAYDYPVKKILYNDFDQMPDIRGNGFTLYGLIDYRLKSDHALDIETHIKNSFFDKIIFTSIFRQYQLFYKLYPLLKKQKADVWIMDGEDTDIIFPYMGRFLKKAYFWFKIRPHRHFVYFKRELTPRSVNSYHYRLLPEKIAKRLNVNKNIKPIGFSIPQQKILKSIPDKIKLFTEHIVDEDVARNLPGKNTGYAFTTEAEYYADIQKSKFGITTKRAGWDCLRHYEIAANGAVMCFKDIDLKPALCAPHGLISGYNCIAYHNYDDLLQKINALTDDNYFDILSNSLKWVNDNSTIAVASKLLKDN